MLFQPLREEGQLVWQHSEAPGKCVLSCLVRELAVPWQAGIEGCRHAARGGARRRAAGASFNRLKSFRGIATRYDKTATSYEAAVSLASFLL